MRRRSGKRALPSASSRRHERDAGRRRAQQDRRAKRRRPRCGGPPRAPPRRPFAGVRGARPEDRRAGQRLRSARRPTAAAPRRARAAARAGRVGRAGPRGASAPPVTRKHSKKPRTIPETPKIPNPNVNSVPCIVSVPRTRFRLLRAPAPMWPDALTLSRPFRSKGPIARPPSRLSPASPSADVALAEEPLGQLPHRGRTSRADAPGAPGPTPTPSPAPASSSGARARRRRPRCAAPGAARPPAGGTPPSPPAAAAAASDVAGSDASGPTATVSARRPVRASARCAAPDPGALAAEEEEPPPAPPPSSSRGYPPGGPSPAPRGFWPPPETLRLNEQSLRHRALRRCSAPASWPGCAPGRSGLAPPPAARRSGPGDSAAPACRRRPRPR